MRWLTIRRPMRCTQRSSSRASSGTWPDLVAECQPAGSSNRSRVEGTGDFSCVGCLRVREMTSQRFPDRDRPTRHGRIEPRRPHAWLKKKKKKKKKKKIFFFFFFVASESFFAQNARFHAGADSKRRTEADGGAAVRSHRSSVAVVALTQSYVLPVHRNASPRQLDAAVALGTLASRTLFLEPEGLVPVTPSGGIVAGAMASVAPPAAMVTPVSRAAVTPSSSEAQPGPQPAASDHAPSLDAAAAPASPLPVLEAAVVSSSIQSQSQSHVPRHRPRAWPRRRRVRMPYSVSWPPTKIRQPPRCHRHCCHLEGSGPTRAQPGVRHAGEPGSSFEQCDIDMNDDEAHATAQCRGAVRYVRRIGGSAPRVVHLAWKIELARGDDGWLIANLEVR